MTSMWRYATSSARRSRGGISDHSFIFGGLGGGAREWSAFRTKVQGSGSFWRLTPSGASLVLRLLIPRAVLEPSE
jgi:hypothetical protein